MMHVQATRELRDPAHDGAASPRPRRAIIVDAERSSQRRLCDDLTRLGCEVRVLSEIADLRDALARDPEADVIAAEYRLAGKRLDDLLAVVPEALRPRLVIVTSYASIASAVRAVKLGVGGYLVKPAHGEQVLRAAGYTIPDHDPDAAGRLEAAQPYRSLDRAVWEFLTLAVEDAGTLSGAARLLGLHARSLRRMLAKYPPPR